MEEQQQRDYISSENIRKLQMQIKIMKIATTVDWKTYHFKGPSKNYVTARGGRGSTNLSHIVTYISGGEGVIL